MIDKLIVFGDTGMLGKYIVSYFCDKIKVITPNYRIINNVINPLELENELLNTGIDNSTCVINCIGSIPQRNSDARTFYVVNGVFPHILSSLCLKYSSKMIQPTTDCVFDGNAGQYIETDIHTETNAYGMSKSIGEPPECTIIRTSIIGEELDNKRSFLEFVKTSKGQIDGWDNHLWNGITCLEYCKLIDTIISNNLFWKGVRHVLSPKPVSKYELACMIKDAYHLNINILKNSTKYPSDKTLRSLYPHVEISTISNQIQELSIYDLNSRYNLYKMRWLKKMPKKSMDLMISDGTYCSRWGSITLETLMGMSEKIKNIRDNLSSFYSLHTINTSRIEYDVTIVMTASNRSKQTYKTLDTILNSKCKNIQVILIDDSTHDIIEIEKLNTYPFVIDFIQINQEKKCWINPCVNYNIGFQYIKGKSVVIQNAEVCHVGDLLAFVNESVSNSRNNYFAFDVRPSATHETNNIIFNQKDLDISVYKNDSLFEIGWGGIYSWYQSAELNNRSLHFLTATDIDTFKRIGGFSYDYAFGDSYDDDDFLLKIIKAGINVVALDHDSVKCGGIHLFHASHYETWSRGIQSNNLTFKAKLQIPMYINFI